MRCKSKVMKYEFDPLQKEIISGLSAGIATTVVTHPLDLIKVRLQLLVIYSQKFGYFDVINQILKDSKKSKIWLEAYRGLNVNLFGNSIAWGLYFGLYRSFKDLIFQLTYESDVRQSEYFNDKKMHTGIYLLAATFSGLTTSILTNPIWILKTRIMGTSTTQGYSSILSGFRILYLTEGYKGLWKGLIPSLFGVSQGAIYFAIYDTLKYHYIHNNVYDKERKLMTWETIGITSLSKMISVTAVYPFQLLKTNLQGFTPNSKLLSLIIDIHSKGGLKGFYKGLLANLLRAIPSTCITFSVYENFKHAL